MNSFKRKALTTAVFAGLGIAAGQAHAVYQDANGLGQALIYPYYTVQQASGNSYNTYISVVNTTTVGKVVKVRFREGKNSREVLDFNLYLSPNDVWTGSIIPAGSDAGSAASLITGDKSCTNPAIPATGINFRNFQYSGTFDDGAGTTLARTREGYVEMLEMGVLPPGASLTAITHVSGTPANCALVQGPVVTFSPALTAPTGGLSGTGTLINVNNGADSGYNAIALANVTTAPIYTDIGSEVGNLAQASPPLSIVITSSASGTRAYNSVWTTGIDAVSATMMHSQTINEYVLDTGSKSNSDWVMTFPTKRFYVTTTTAAAPFTNKFTATGSCEPISLTYYNREEAGTTNPGDFSPLPSQQTSALCWESTVVSFNNGQAHMPASGVSGVLGSVNVTSATIASAFQNGWANMTFTGTGATAGLVSQATSTTANLTTAAATVTGAQTFQGLPVVGFMVRTFNNGTLTCGGATCQGNYGSAFTHNFVDSASPAP